MVDIVETVSSGSPSHLLIGLFFFALISLFEILRLYRLVADDAVGFLWTRGLYITSFFFNNLLPGTIGGDSNRVIV